MLQTLQTHSLAPWAPPIPWCRECIVHDPGCLPICVICVIAVPISNGMFPWPQLLLHLQRCTMSTGLLPLDWSAQARSLIYMGPTCAVFPLVAAFGIPGLCDVCSQLSESSPLNPLIPLQVLVLGA